MNGAVITDWSTPKYLRTYKSGILTPSTSVDKHPNHASVIIGWGSLTNSTTQQESKYWIVRNSAGPRWGMDGDMWLPRGENIFMVESHIIAFDAEMI